jgi:hypothetical protein
VNCTNCAIDSSGGIVTGTGGMVLEQIELCLNWNIETLEKICGIVP